MLERLKKLRRSGGGEMFEIPLEEKEEKTSNLLPPPPAIHEPSFSPFPEPQRREQGNEDARIELLMSKVDLILERLKIIEEKIDMIYKREGVRRYDSSSTI